jgi:hypothetical protein
MNPDKKCYKARPVTRAKFMGQRNYFSSSPNIDLDL